MDAGISAASGLRPQDRLRQTVAEFPAQSFAVVDGAQFEDVSILFRRDRLFARSLFLDTADEEVQKAGPWLVKLDQDPNAIGRLQESLFEKPAAVYWCCEDGEMALWRHLRTLNVARIPAWAADGEETPSGPEAFEIVMFRHWDPRVLGGLLPTLLAIQFTRIMGPAQEIAFWADDYGGLKRVIRDAEWPCRPPGLLTIDTNQILALSERRSAASRMRIALYLRGAAPDETANFDDEDLRNSVRTSEESGRALGLRTERGLGQWAFLMTKSSSRASEKAALRSFVLDGRDNVHNKVSCLARLYKTGRI